MTACESLHERLSAFLDGELDDAAAAEVRDHLAGCAECAELARALDLVLETAGSLASRAVRRTCSYGTRSSRWKEHRRRR